MDAVFGFVVNNCDILFSSEFGITFGRGQFASVTFSSEFGLIPSGESNYGYAMLPAFASFGGEELDGYGAGYSELPALTSSGSGGFYIPPTPVWGYAEIPRITSFGLVTTSCPGDVNSILPAFQSIGGEGNYGVGESTIPAVRSYGNEGLPVNVASAITAVYLFDGVGVTQDYIVFVDWNGQITDTLTGTRILIDTIITSLEISGTYSVIGTFLASLSDSLNIIDSAVASVGDGTNFAPAVDGSARVWVVNIDTGTTSQYDNYGYASFYSYGGKNYGVAEDGIYELTGNTDNGVDIDALVDFGRTDLGSMYKKRVTSAYVDVGSDGKMELVIETDGQTSEFEANSFSAAVSRHRINMGSTLSGYYWNPVLTNNNGYDFDLAIIMLEIMQLNRRL